jgi:hypothetical protein
VCAFFFWFSSPSFGICKNLSNENNNSAGALHHVTPNNGERRQAGRQAGKGFLIQECAPSSSSSVTLLVRTSKRVHSEN